ncbi:unnamed protein product, partial [Ectocarpus fasciculatus]
MLHLFIVLFALLTETEACTTLICGRLATADGSVIASHSSDGGGTLDPRLVRVPAQDFPEGSKRPVYPSPENYPRYVGTERGVEEYHASNCLGSEEQCTDLEPMGYIDQVPHTYSYFECTYGIMNEHQVGIAESTCSGVFVARPISVGGKALFSIDALSQIALERSATARGAVETMGALAEQYGFYGESASFEGGAESLLVSDPSEGWVFHVLPDPTGTSAIWAAQRVPDDSVAVVANMFIIREVNLSDTTNFLGSASMWDIALAEGLWKEGEPMDFTATFSDGEYAHKYYSGRRMWGAYRLLSPETDLSPEYGNLKSDAPYPFAAPVSKSKLLSPADFMAVHRDWYNGTEYSQSADNVLAGGPYETPDRYSGSTGEMQVSGSWERPIALFRTASSFIVQSKAYLSNDLGGVIWWGAHAPHGTSYVPILPGSMLNSPPCLSHVYQGVFDLTTSFWAHRAVLNFAQIKFSYIIKDIQALQSEMESTSQKLVSELVTKYSRLPVVTTDMKEDITEVLISNVLEVRDAFVSLFYELVYKYADGYLNSINAAGKFTSASTGYPAWWLEAVGFTDGPPPVDDATAQVVGK